MGKYELDHRFPIDRHDPIHPHNPHLGKLVHTWDAPTVLIDTLGVAERNDPEVTDIAGPSPTNLCGITIQSNLV